MEIEIKAKVNNLANLCNKVLALGAKFTKKHLPARFLGQFEVAANAPYIKNNKMWLDIFLDEMIQKDKTNTIGGCVTSLLISEKDSGLLLGGTAKESPLSSKDEILSEVRIADKKPACVLNNKITKLASFIRYEDMFLKEYPKAENFEI